MLLLSEVLIQSWFCCDITSLANIKFLPLVVMSQKKIVIGFTLLTRPTSDNDNWNLNATQEIEFTIMNIFLVNCSPPATQFHKFRIQSYKTHSD